MTSNSADAQDIAGVILTGGAGRRMGTVPKPLLPLGPDTIFDHVVRRAQPQVQMLALSVHHLSSATRDAFARFPGPLLVDPPQLLRPDDRGGRVGPLAGILAALGWAESLGLEWLAVFPGDTPFIPLDYVARLYHHVADGGACAAHAVSGGRSHPVASVWSVRLRPVLWRAVAAGERRVGRWLSEQGAIGVEWTIDDANGGDPFFNINEPDDLKRAGTFLSVAGMPLSSER
ncbi:molybdenum cofactor guanylyltransferase [Insolitispirillum peregrinum]|uniref:Molybdenum cofactor guanylyltransferase n=1 Tax=Insolitispirillum peregrinum TaxID=80876 RepID=A0A1N7IKB2_9PROT|nr:molybdenum cofactor guanylyltransferase [Insolitispirillum peregrinum]SIS37525.1 molybdenum cofactor guanylyltransferase [Insolitispirillum peregrinum]